MNRMRMNQQPALAKATMAQRNNLADNVFEKKAKTALVERPIRAVVTVAHSGIDGNDSKAGSLLLIDV
ncbi:hypothetical protein D3C71_2151680 [compost metagenome]